MYAFGLEIRRDRREKEYSMKICYTCGKILWIPKDRLRVYNYCNPCAPLVV